MAVIVDVNQYKYNKKGPLDAKALVKKYSDLLNPDTWTVDGTVSAYNGMITSVWLNTADPTKNGVYYLFDPEATSALKVPDVTVEANWHKLNSTSDIDAINTKINSLEAEASRLSSELYSRAHVDDVYTKDETVTLIADAVNDIPTIDLTPYAKQVDVDEVAARAIANEAAIDELNDKIGQDIDLLVLKSGDSKTPR